MGPLPIKEIFSAFFNHYSGLFLDINTICGRSHAAIAWSLVRLRLPGLPRLGVYGYYRSYAIQWRAN